MRRLILQGFLSVIGTTVLWSCGPKGSSNESDIDGLEACSGLFGKAYNDCVVKQSGGNSTIDRMVGELTQSGGMIAKNIVGSAYAIKYAGNYRECKVLEGSGGGQNQCNYVDACLAIRGNIGVWEPCNNYSVEQQFHFLDQIPIKFSLPGAGHESMGFRIATRASVISHYRAGDSEANRDFLCLQPQPNQVSLVKCDSATYFMTLMNKFDDSDDRARKKEGQYVSLVALVGKTAALTNQMEAESNKNVDIFADILGDADADEAASRDKEALRANRKYTSLGNFAGDQNCNSFRFLANIGGKAVGKCPSADILAEQNNIANNHVFLHSCGDPDLNIGANCTGLDPIKNFYDHAEARDWGMVVKISPKVNEHNCLQIQGQSIKEIDQCNKNSADNPSIQFRAEPLVKEEMNNGKSKIRLRSLQNPSLCADLAGDKLVDCRNAPKLTFDPVANDILIRKGDKWQSYFMTMCLVATSHTKNGRYDCQREIPWKYDLYEKLSIGLAFIPYFGPVLATVFDGMLCASNEEKYAASGCIGLGLDLSLGVLLGDFLPLGSLGVGTMKAAAKAGNASKSALFAVSSSARTALRKTAVRTGYNATSVNGSFLVMNKSAMKALTQKDFSVNMLLEAFKKARSSANCAGASCNGWWNPAPRPGQETKEYLTQFAAYVSRSQMPAQDKALVLKKLKEAQN